MGLFSSRMGVTRTLLLSLTLVLSIALAASQTLPCDSSQESNPKTLDNTSKMAGNRERTFIMLKPDAVQRGLVGEIIKRFEQKGFKLVAMKMMHASVEHLEEHYADLKGEGLNVVKTGRVMLGETNPAASAPGTIRGDFSIQVGRNMCHGSDAVESANKEIALWFKDEELIKWDPVTMGWVYEDFEPTV